MIPVNQLTATDAATKAAEILERIRGARNLTVPTKELATIEAFNLTFALLCRSKLTNLNYNAELIKKLADFYIVPFTSLDDLANHGLTRYPSIDNLKAPNACLCGNVFGAGGQLVTHCPDCKGYFSDLLGTGKFKILTHHDLDTLACRIGYMLGDYCINNYAMYNLYRAFLVHIHSKKVTNDRN